MSQKNCITTRANQFERRKQGFAGGYREDEHHFMNGFCLLPSTIVTDEELERMGLSQSNLYRLTDRLPPQMPLDRLTSGVIRERLDSQMECARFAGGT
jgi:hypothetical protein